MNAGLDVPGLAVTFGFPVKHKLHLGVLEGRHTALLFDSANATPFTKGLFQISFRGRQTLNLQHGWDVIAPVPQESVFCLVWFLQNILFLLLMI